MIKFYKSLNKPHNICLHLIKNVFEISLLYECDKILMSEMVEMEEN